MSEKPQLHPQVPRNQEWGFSILDLNPKLSDRSLLTGRIWNWVVDGP